VVVVLPDPFRGVGEWRNSTETQQSGHAPRSEPEVKNGRSGAETAPTSRRLNVVMWSPPFYLKSEPKWRDNYPEGTDHPVALNRLESMKPSAEKPSVKKNLGVSLKRFHF